MVLVKFVINAILIKGGCFVVEIFRQRSKGILSNTVYIQFFETC